MGVTLGGKPCIDPVALWETARTVQPPLPTWNWWGKANSFSCRAGAKEGRGTILLHRGQLDSLDLNARHDLTFDYDRTVTVKGLVILHAECVTPRERGNKQSAYAVEVADIRWPIRQFSPLIDKAYNVRSLPGSSTYYAATLNTGSQWTWTQMVSDLWSAVGTSRLGNYPGLPFSPHGTPEGFEYYQTSAYAALNDVLARLACVLAWNPFTNTFSIARVGSTDAAEAAAELRWDAVRVWDDDPVEPAMATLPQYVRVVFRRSPAPTDGSSPWYSVDVADTSPSTGYYSGGYLRLRDDMAALGSSGTPSNSTALAARAAERAADWFRARKDGWSRLRKVYRDVIPEQGFSPGSRLAGLAFEDRGLGYKTEIVRGGAGGWDRGTHDWPDVWPSPIDQDGDGDDDRNDSSSQSCCEPGFAARVTSVTYDAMLGLWVYSWEEVTYDCTGVSVLSGGRTGTDNAYNLGSADASALPYGTVVWIRPNGECYAFYEVEQFFPAQIGLRSGHAYRWQEVEAGASGAWAVRTHGRTSGTAYSAYELNLRDNVPAGTVVWMTKRGTTDLGEYAFAYETPLEDLCAGYYTGDKTPVMDASFDASTCTLTVVKETVTIECGLIVDWS